MKLSIFGVRWPVTTSMIFLSIVILGGFAWTQVGIDLMPDFEIPAITIITSYTGAGPQEVESRITEPIEESVSTVQNVDEVTSASFEGVSAVTVKFNWGIDLAEATNDIRDKLDLVSKMLPDKAENPMIFKFNTSMIPVVILGVSGEESWEKLDRIVDKKVIESLKRIPGVATAMARGGDKRGILCHLNRERMQATGLTGRQIVGLMSNQNLDNPGGHLRSGQFDYLIRTPEEFRNIDEIGSVVLTKNSGIVRLRDVAEIKDGFLERTGDFLLNGKRAVGIIVQKQSGANTVSVSKAVIDAIPEIQAQLPSDVKIEVFFDTSEFIRNTIKNLSNSVLMGGLVVFLVILFFLRDFRASLIVCTTIPTSLIITFLLMYLAGYTINQITLSSLAIAIGMVVDNAIVIVDNIKRYLERRVSARESSIWGSVEMGTSVMASTLTTIVIFLPIIFTSGIAQIFFGQLAMIIIMALTASLISALMLTPMLCSRFLKPASKTSQNTNSIQLSSGFSFLDWLENKYSNFLTLLLQHRLKVIFFMVALLAISIGFAKMVGIEFIPEQDQGRLVLRYEMSTGTRYEITGQVGEKIMEIIRKKVPELQSMVLRFGKSADSIGAVITGSKEGSHTGQVELRLSPKESRKRSVKQVIEDIRPALETIPGVIIRFDSGDPLGNMMGAGGAGFTLNLYGHDLKTGMLYAQELVKLLSGVNGLKDLEISQQLAQPELQVVVDREKASNLGLNVTDIGKTVELCFSGDDTVKYREGGEEYDIEVRLREEDRMSFDDLSQVPLQSSTGQAVRVENVARIKHDFGPTRITRNEQERYIQITGQVYGRGSGDVAKDAELLINSVPLPPGFSWKFAGNEQERRKSFLLMLQAAALGMILVYMVMASQFESLLAPFIIFLSVPFGFIGAVQILALTGYSISLVSLLGFIILIGIVVNNGIVLVSYINILVQRRIPLNDALVQAGKSRLRPVLSTTLTTILGMAPMAMSKGEGSEIWVPLALSVIGGLVISTIMTMLLMPVLYSLFSRRLLKTLNVKRADI
ncbi:MAG: efflux RND transporter permease subunit [Candidatus Riflebacteria bacterium]|nr:efflux RND transporter permease subunit [Candidatus Riflebacteria bacterium]